jgi:putative mRNA 3-end processing factor
MARKSRGGVAEATPVGGGDPVTWRDGVHVAGTSIWCDARRARDVCFVSAADRPVRANHGQLIATRETLVLLGSASGDHLPAPYGRPFTLGTVRLELVPTGHAIGAAALWVEHQGRRVLYTGAIASGRHVGLGAPAELRGCDALVIEARYARQEHRFPPATEAAAALVAWTRATVETKLAVVLVTSPGKGLDVAAELAAAGIEVVAHRAVHHAAQRLRAAGLLPELAIRRPPGTGARPGRALVWLVRDRLRLDAAAPPAARAIALASGLATEPGVVAALGVDAAFAWSNAADRDGLLSLVRASGAREVFVTGPCAPELVRALGERARVLGPPRQMALFEEPG